MSQSRLLKKPLTRGAAQSVERGDGQKGSETRKRRQRTLRLSALPLRSFYFESRFSLLKALWQSVPWESGGGGKSGSLFCKTLDDRYLIKQVRPPAPSPDLRSRSSSQPPRPRRRREG